MVFEAADPVACVVLDDPFETFISCPGVRFVKLLPVILLEC